MRLAENLIKALSLLFVQDLKNTLAPHFGHIVPLILNVLVVLAVVVQNLGDGPLLLRGSDSRATQKNHR